MAAQAQVWAIHPDVTVPALFQGPAFEQVWSPKGWQAIPIDLAAASAALGEQYTDPAALPVEYVTQLAAEAGAAPPDPTPEQEPSLPPAIAQE